MAGMIEDLVNSFGGPILEDIGAKVGLPADVVKKAMPVVTGLAVAAIGRLSKQPDGADQISNLLKGVGDSFGGGDLAAFVKGADPAKSADLLKTLAGPNSVENITANLAKKSGLPADSVGKLLGVAMPAVLGQLGTMAKGQGLNLDPAGVAKLIDDNAGALKGLGDVDNLMDNVPGIADDVKRALNKLFKG